MQLRYTSASQQGFRAATAQSAVVASVFAHADTGIAVGAQGAALVQPVINGSGIAVGALSGSGHCSSSVCTHTGAQVDFCDAPEAFICVSGTDGEAGSCIEPALEHSSAGDDNESLCRWPSKLVSSAETLISVYGTGDAAGSYIEPALKHSSASVDVAHADFHDAAVSIVGLYGTA